MEVRSDWTLELQLEKVAEYAVDRRVHEWIRRALEHMSRGTGGHRRGGAELVALLTEARQRAADYDEWHVVRLLQDSIDYAEGRILQPVFEEQYRIFQDGIRDKTDRDFAGSMISAFLDFAAGEGQKYLADHPDAMLPEVMAHLGMLAQDAKFMLARENKPGRYQIPRGQTERILWLERVLRNRVDIEDPAQEARRIASSPEAVALLAADPDGQIVLRAAELQRRAAGLAELRKVIEDPHAAEEVVRQALKGQYWIFGGRYVDDKESYRRLVPGDEYDIPLIRGDGTLQIVELKRAMAVSPLVKRHRGAWVPTAEVNDAVSQALAYLVGLDEHRLRIRGELGIETRRASAIVLIGHPAAQADVSAEEIYEAIRRLNAHLTRIEVLTYKELVDNAERSIGGPVSS